MLSKTLELNPDDVIAMFYLAYSLKEVGNIDDSINLYNEIISRSPDYSWAYYNLASIYFEQNRDDLAIEYLNKTIKINPNDVPAIKFLIKILSKNRNYAEAEKILKQATTKMPLEADLFYLFAQLYKTMNSKINYLKYLKYTEKKSSTFTGNFEALLKEIEEAEG